MNNYKQLGCAVALQAAKDYDVASPIQRKKILKDLRSEWMDFITNGLAFMLADELERDYKTVLRRISFNNDKYEEDF